VVRVVWMWPLWCSSGGGIFRERKRDFREIFLERENVERGNVAGYFRGVGEGVMMVIMVVVWWLEEF